MNPVQKVAAWLRTQKTLGRWALRAIPDTRRTIQIDPIGAFVIRLRRNRSFWLRHPLTHEGMVLGSLRRLIRPGDCVYDIGANIGLYARFMTHFGAGRVVAFEPMSENRPLLLENCRRGGIEDRVTVLPFALADADGQERFQIDRVTTGSAALDRVTAGHASESHEQYGVSPETELVEVRRLDTLLRERPDLPPPRVLKIDIEGAETLCLRGADETLARHGPRMVIELHAPIGAGAGAREGAATGGESTPDTGGDPDEVRREVFTALDTHGYYVYGYTFADPAQRRWQRITPAVLDELGGLFDLHHVVASRDESEVREAVELFAAPSPSRR